MTEEKLREKQEQKFERMESERNWFRAEALKQHKKCKELQTALRKLRTASDTAHEEKDFLQNKLLSSKQTNKELRKELESNYKALATQTSYHSIASQGGATFNKIFQTETQESPEPEGRNTGITESRRKI